jgi:hypothetical protein
VLSNPKKEPTIGVARAKAVIFDILPNLPNKKSTYIAVSA